MAAGRICTGPSTAGAALSIFLSSRRNSKAAYRFLGKILNNVKKWQIPRFINTDKAPAYGRALALLKREGRCPSDVEHRQIKYRNNVIECDHGKLKRIIGATLSAGLNITDVTVTFRWLNPSSPQE